MALPQGVMGWPEVHDCGISLTFVSCYNLECSSCDSSKYKMDKIHTYCINMYEIIHQNEIGKQQDNIYSYILVNNTFLLKWCQSLHRVLGLDLLECIQQQYQHSALRIPHL